MLCEKCKKNQATFHYKSNHNGKVTEKHLCSECAKDDGYFEKQKFAAFEPFSLFENSPEGLLGGFFKNMMDLPDERPRINDSVCKKCGYRFSDFLNEGKLGCSECYTTFASLLEPTIRKIHGNTKHCGNIPEGNASDETLKKRKIDDLKQKLSKAIEEQEYEMAAKYRDEIKELEGEGGK